MQSEIAIDIDAPPDLVFALASDVQRWATLLPHYVRSTAVSRTSDGEVVAEFVARRPLIGVLGLGLPVAWRSRTWNEPATRRLRFVHVAGATKGMDVTWRIESVDRAGRTLTAVTIRHDFRPRLPVFAAFVDRYFTRPIAGRTLATFKTIAEALAAQSADAPSTKTST
ncbi:MAG: type II toxin-antitoxin system RatA family toxin [Candidatus Limnocylindrales bacterium]